MSNFNKLSNVLAIEYSKQNLLNIQETFEILKNNVTDRELENIINNSATLLKCTYKMGYDLNINLDDVVYLIHNSNMSKLCKTEKQAQDTVIDYKNKYQDGSSPYDSPAYKKSDDNKYYIVYNESSKKILKSIDYDIVNLVPLITNKDKIEHDGVSNLCKVKEFNIVFEAKCYNEFTKEMLDDDKFVNLRLGLIEEEINELKDAVNNNDIIEIADALGDILYVVYGMIHTMGIEENVNDCYKNNLEQ